MSLVDYASTSDEDEPQAPSQEEEESEQVEDNPDKRLRFGVPAAGQSSPAPPNNNPTHAHSRLSRNLGQPSNQMEIVSNQSSELKLPDASLLLDSPALPSNLLNASDHSSQVAAAMAESSARKRDLDGSSASYPRNKVPKRTFHRSKSVSDTEGGRLLPPQLAGRSNIVTEDISKLFVRKHASSSTE